MVSKKDSDKPTKRAVERLSVWISSALVEKVKLLALEKGVRPSTIVNELLKNVRAIDVAAGKPEDESVVKENPVYRLDPEVYEGVRRMAFELRESHSRLLTLALENAPEPGIQRNPQ